MIKPFPLTGTNKLTQPVGLALKGKEKGREEQG